MNGKNKMYTYIKDFFTYRRKVKKLQEMIKVQCRDGTWNNSEYLWGMANGMIYSLSVIKEWEPHYKENPFKTNE